MKNLEFLTPVLASILGAGLVLLAQNTFMHPMPPVATVDIESLMNEHAFRNHVENPNYDPSAVGNAVELALQQTADAHDVIIMVRPAVLKGAPDLTLEASRRLNELLN